jgi:hypothetical protein
MVFACYKERSFMAIEEIENVKNTGTGNAQVEAYRETQRIEAEKKMILTKVAEKYGLNPDMIIKSGVEPHQLKEFIKEAIGNNGSTEFNGEKKQSLYAKLGYNIDGLAVSASSYIKEASKSDTGSDSGGNSSNSGGGSKGDSVQMVSENLPKGKVKKETISLFGDED